MMIEFAITFLSVFDGLIRLLEIDICLDQVNTLIVSCSLI